MEIAQQLGNKGLDEVIASYQEINVAKSRIYAILFAFAWAGFWYVLGPGDQPKSPRGWNYPQCLLVLPVLIPMLLLSVAWWIGLKKKWIPQNIWTDAIGAIANILGCALILSRSWDLMICFICYIPMSAVTVGARFNRKIFYLYVLFGVLVVQFASPSNYWLNRPHFAAFAITLCVFLPLSTNRLLSSLKSVSEEAIRSRDAQSRFVATMSHEFRTPLSSVISNAEFIDTDAMSKNQREIMESLTSAARALRNRVNDVLDVRAIDAGKLSILEEAFTFKGLLKTIQSVIDPQALAKNIDFRCVNSDIPDLVLRSDPGRLEQVLINLCSNAVKFTPDEGSVELRVVRSGPDHDGRVPVLITVSDTGPGIPDSEKDRIFLPFHQVSTGAARKGEGIGLGLHLVKSIVAYLQGNVDVRDREEGGSVFSVALTFERAKPGEKPAQYFNLKEAVKEHRKHVKPMRCLVVDDKATNREIAERLFSLVGHSMVGASNGDAGIQEAKNGEFDVILLDLHMPVRSGYSVLKELASDSVTRKIPVVMVSADANPDAIEKTRELGASGYITKPISFAKLLALLEEISNSKNSDVQRNVVMVSDDSDSEELMSGLDVMRASGEPESTISFINTCLAGIDESMEGMYSALRRGDHPAAAMAAHALKNELINVGFPAGAKACGDFRVALEQGTADIVLHRISALIDLLKYQLRAEQAQLSEPTAATV